jgi:hypothetical protein
VHALIDRQILGDAVAAVRVVPPRRRLDERQAVRVIADTTMPPNMMPPVPFTCMGITICVV